MRKKLVEMFESMIAEIMSGMGVPGLSIVIVKDGVLEYSRGFGSRDLERNLPMTPDTLFGIGSISKSFTALAINILAEQGKLNLDDPAKKYIDFRLGSRKDPITIHHFLTHSSGINPTELNFITAERLLGFSDYLVPLNSKEDFLLHINGAVGEVYEDPGKIHLYHNDLYSCLVFIVEEITGILFPEFVRNNILNPLEMERTTFSLNKYLADKNASVGYITNTKGKHLPREPVITGLDMGAGGIMSSVNELSNYMISMMNMGVFEGTKIAEESTIKKMLTPYIETGDYHGGSYAYGWEVEKDFFGHTLIQHGGDAFISGGFMGFIPELKLGVIIGQNNNAATSEILSRAILAILLGVDINQAAPLLAVQNKIQKLIGHYETYKGVIKFDIIFEGGILYAKLRYTATPNMVKFPIVIEDLDLMKFFIPIAIPGLEIRGQAFINEYNGDVDIRVSRWMFHKIKR